jgi:hypothetical protein
VDREAHEILLQASSVKSGSADIPQAYSTASFFAVFRKSLQLWMRIKKRSSRARGSEDLAAQRLDLLTEVGSIRLQPDFARSA